VQANILFYVFIFDIDLVELCDAALASIAEYGSWPQ